MDSPPATSTSTAIVLLASALAARAGDQASVTVSGQSVREIIEALERVFPGFRFHLCYETGELRPFVNVFVNGENARYLHGLDTPVPDGSTIHILPSVAGG